MFVWRVIFGLNDEASRFARDPSFIGDQDSMKPEVLDLNTLMTGPVRLEAFRERLTSFDVTPYIGKHVQLKGCAPTWAHLMMAGKLFGTAQAVDFLLDDKNGAQPVEVWRKKSNLSGVKEA